MFDTTKQLNFVELAIAGRRTKTWDVFNSRTEGIVGQIKYEYCWRQYVFHPAAGTIHEKNCLRIIAQFCEDQSRRLRATWGKGNVDSHPNGRN